METSSILTADILDILFEGRNKNYGAYELRKTYDRRIMYALAGTFTVCLLLLVGSILANGKKKSMQDELGPVITLEKFKEEPKPEIPKEIPPPEQKPIATIKDVVPRIVPDDQVTKEDEVKPVDELENVKIGTANIKGDKEDDIVNPPVESKGVIDKPKVEEDIDRIYISVQKQASFPGGMGEWTKFLQRNLNRDLPSENGAPPADYTVTVSFVVDRNGNVSDVKADNDPGYGTKDEAIRVIRKGPKWKPAEQNGNKVMYRQKQNITFRVSAD